MPSFRPRGQSVDVTADSVAMRLRDEALRAKAEAKAAQEQVKLEAPMPHHLPIFLRVLSLL